MSAKKSKPAEKKTAKSAAKPAPAQPAEKTKKTYGVLRGLHDILPREEKYWKKYYRAAQGLAEYFQFGRIETPVLEEAGLFVRSIGRGTDIVEKEMYLFEDRDGTKVALRPEGTAAVVRAYLSNGLWNQAQPVKVWYWEPMFRHERPQAGRYRQHYQLGFETLGVKDPAVDAELMLMAYNLYAAVGLPVEMHVNSLGAPEERERYAAELVSHYRSKRSYLCEHCRARLIKNPLRLLDCKEEQCQPVKESAPQLIDWLGEDSKGYFMKVLEFLDELSIPYVLSPYLVRGLDYYTHTVFEIYPAASGAAESAGAGAPAAGETAGAKPAAPGSQSALGGGGRYDLLIEQLGGKPTPAAGVAIGLERAISELKHYVEQNPSLAPTDDKYQIYFAQLGDDAKRQGLRIIDQLRSSGIKPAFNFFKNSLKNQLETANGLKVSYVVILGQKEVQDKTVIIRDMESGVQEIVDQKKLEAALKRKLGLS